jgi:hypothetical protein
LTIKEEEQQQQQEEKQEVSATTLERVSYFVKNNAYISQIINITPFLSFSHIFCIFVRRKDNT